MDTDEEEDEVAQNDITTHTLPRLPCTSLSSLEVSTRFTRSELRRLYRGFKQECPGGYVSEEAFTAIYTGYFAHSDATDYARLVFHTCTDGEAHMTFDKFVKILSCLARGTTSEKLRWLFNLYDVRGVGTLNLHDVQSVVQAIYCLAHGHSSHTVRVAEAKAYHLFKSMDRNCDGQVSFDEFCSWCLKSDGQLNVFDTALE